MPASSLTEKAFAVEVENIARRFGTVEALAGVSIRIREGEFFSLLGPSGCGKTTLLRIIAGLDLPDSGSLKICGTDALEIPAHKRPVNTVFQSYALFPHMTVWDNIAFGLRMKKISSPQLNDRVARVMSLVRIEELASRFPSQISGGQKQRVALARALVNEPKVLLLDEPLGALDLKLRKELQIELHQLQRRVGTTFIYVTHDQEEALVMSHRLAVMNAGRIEQMDNAQNLYERPRTRFVAQFLGSCNLIQGKVLRADSECMLVETLLADLQLNSSTVHRKLSANKAVTLAIRPEKIIFQTGEPISNTNQIRALIEDLIYSGAETQFRFQAKGHSFSAVALNATTKTMSLKIGDAVSVFLPPEALILLDD